VGLIAEADVADAAVLAARIIAIMALPLESRAFARSPGGAPFEFRLTALAPDTTYRVAVVVADVDGKTGYDTAVFTTLGVSNYMPEAEYDGMWGITYRAAATYTLPRNGVLTGNGKLAVRSSLSALACEHTYLAGVFDFNKFGGYTNNVIGTFEASGIDFFSQYSPSAFSLATQTLNMQTGIVTSTGTVYGSGFTLAVEYDVIPLRHMPYCALTSVRFAPDADLADLRVFHTLRGPDTLHQPRFECSVVYTNDTTSVTCMLADAALKNSELTVASATVYFPSPATSPAWRNLGFNTVRNRDTGFNGFLFEGLAQGQRVELSFLTAHASSADFREPLTDCKRMALGAMGNYGSAAKIRADHVAAWARTWANSAILTPKAGISVAEEARVQTLRRALRVAQFNIYSCMRDHTATEVNPASIDALDLDGNLFWNRELWLVPAMLYLKPRFVRNMIEHRFRALTMARAFAGSQGFEGVKFVFADDILGNDHAPYWDVTPGTYVFNTCLVAIAAWDYFRVSQDKEWLASKGFAVISGIADCVCSIIDAGGIAQARSVSGEPVERPAFKIGRAHV
jgi:trehalose/maltose hydrolase-like predicted phosphorylase